MNYPKLKNIFGDVYTEDFFSSGSRYSQTLNEKGILIFNSFIGSDGLKILQKEANELKEQSYRSSSEYNVYISEYDNTFSSDSPRNRIMSTSKKCIPNDLIPKDSILQRLYDSSFLKDFFCELLDKKTSTLMKIHYPALILIIMIKVML